MKIRIKVNEDQPGAAPVTPTPVASNNWSTAPGSGGKIKINVGSSKKAPQTTAPEAPKVETPVARPTSRNDLMAERDRMNARVFESGGADQEAVNRLTEINRELQATKTHEDTFIGQSAASYTQGRLSQDSALAWNAYLKNPSAENRKAAETIDAQLKDFQTRNAEALAGDATLPWLSQSLAGYLPQFVDQTRSQVLGGIAGATVGSVVPIIGTGAGLKAGVVAGSGMYSFDTMRGAAFRELLALGMSEEQARKAASDEALVSALIEMADTGFDIATLGIGKLIGTATKSGAKAVAGEAAEGAVKKVLKALAGYGLNIAGEMVEEGAQEAVSIANQRRDGTGALNLAGSAMGVGLGAGLSPLSGDEQAKNDAAQIRAAAAEGGKIAAIMGGATKVATAATNKVIETAAKRELKKAVADLVDKAGSTKYNETVSTAAAPDVQQAVANAENVRAANPESDVLDAATTLYMGLVTQQGKNSMKKSQEKAAIVQSLILGQDVQPRDINKLNLTDTHYRDVFTKLTGVQFPEGSLTTEQVYSLARSAHQVAQEAEVEKATEVVQQVAAQAESAEPASTSFEEFAARFKQHMPEADEATIEAAYQQFQHDTETATYNGQPITRQDFKQFLRSAPGGDQLTEPELDTLFDNLKNNEEANNGPRSILHGAGLQGVSDPSESQHGGGLSESAGRAEEESSHSGGPRGDAGRLREGDGRAVRQAGDHVPGRGSVLNTDSTVSGTVVAADGRTVYKPIPREAYTDEMLAQESKFARVGVALHAATGAIPIPGTQFFCDGAMFPGTETVVQADSPYFTFVQLCDHESLHQYFYRDPKLLAECLKAYLSTVGKKRKAELFNAYKAKYGAVYDGQTSAKLQNDILEEIICDAYAGMDRGGAGADRLQSLIKPIVDAWCAEQDAMMADAQTRYSIDSMAETVGLTFEKDGQMTVFKDEKGRVVDKVTEDMIRKSPLGGIIAESAARGLIAEADVGKQVTFFSELFNMMLNIQDIDLLWAVSATIGFQPIESGARDPQLKKKSKFAGYTKNSDPQYSTTVDFTTICVKTQAIIDAMSATMVELGHGLTEQEIVEIVYRNTHDAGEPVPCPVCYVFSRWVGLGGLFDRMNQLQTQYANADTETLSADIATLERQIDDIMVERGYALTTKKGKRAYTIPGKSSSSDKSFGDARTIMYKELVRRQTELQSKQNADLVSGKKTMTAAENKELSKLKEQIQILDNWTWLKDVRLAENYEPVPPEILFDINAGKVFAEEYPESWKFRTTRGPSMGKAATPYADEHLGQILRGVGVSDLSKAELGNPAKNPFLKSKDGKLTKAAEKALRESRLKAKVQNLLNGQRYQSTSDFRFEYALDYLLSFVEMQALGSKVQLYTKVAEAVRMFASVLAEVNCSLMPEGDGYRVNKDGTKTLTFSSITGMNAEDAFQLSSEFDNVQPIMVGVNNEHIRLCMADDRITFIIPYHASGAGEARYVALMQIVGENVERRTDYSSFQTDHQIEDATPAQKAAYDLRLKLLTGKLGMLSDADKQILKSNEVLHNLYKRFYGQDADGNRSDIDPKYLSPAVRESGKLFHDPECAGVFLTKDQAKTVMPFEYWDRTSTIDTADTNGQAFVDYCESLGLRPRFAGWDAKGSYHADMDFSKIPGYWKMLIDRRCYNRDGTYHEQQAINVSNFDAGFLFREEAIKGIVQPSKVNDPNKTSEIAAKSAAQVREGRGESKYSITLDDSEETRYEKLKNLTIIPATVNPDKVSGIDLASFNTTKKSAVEKPMRDLAKLLGITNVDLKNSAIDFRFQFSNESLRKSLKHQLNYGGSYLDYAKAMTCFEDLIKNAVLIETHRDYKHGTPKADSDLKQTYVLISAMRDETGITPIEFEVKENYTVQNQLYLTVMLTKIDPEVLGEAYAVQDGSNPHLFSESSAIMIADLLRYVNPADGEFLKYVPDGFLNDAQKEAKQNALARRAAEYPAANTSDDESGAFVLPETKFSIVTDPEVIERLENDDYLTVYKAMQVIDGELYPPMAAEVKDEKGKRHLKQPSKLGQWQQAEENPSAIKSFKKPDKKHPEGYGVFELLKGTGKSKDDITAAYNPYEHTSNIVLNDQFETAYKRPNLVTVEFHIPKSEADGLWDANMQTTGAAYKAKHAKDSVGLLTDWKPGPVAKELQNSHRDIYLTRWSKPVRILDDAEVAQKYKEILDNEPGVTVPFNVVTPSLRAELEKAGVAINYDGSAQYQYLQRKAAEKAGTKYSIYEDNDGNALTEDQQKFFSKSKAIDWLGRLIKMYHGSRNFGFTWFDPSFSDDGRSLFFTNDPATARTYSGSRKEDNDIHALSKDTDMTRYMHSGEFDTEADAWDYLESAGYKKLLPDPITPEQVQSNIKSSIGLAIDEANEWLTALEMDLPKLFAERHLQRMRDYSLGHLKQALMDLESTYTEDGEGAFYEDLLYTGMSTLYGAEQQVLDDIEYFFNNYPRVEFYDVYEGLRDAISDPESQGAQFERLRDAGYADSPAYVVYSPTDGVFHLAQADLIAEARRVFRDSGKGLYEVYLNLENPLEIDANGYNWDELNPEDLHEYGLNEGVQWEGETTREIAEWAEEHGYDGVIIKNLWDRGRYATGDENEATIMIAFKPEQVKSTANKSPTKHPDIRYSIVSPELSFADQVDLVAMNKLNEVLEPGVTDTNPNGLTVSAVYVAKEPNPMMQDLGYGDLPLVVTQHHIRQMLGQREDVDGNLLNEHNHQLTRLQVKRMPDMLRNPAAVIRAKNRPESLIFITTMKDYAGRPIIIPVKANGINLVYDGKVGPAHVVTSMYGRDNFGKFFDDAVKAGSVVYYNEKRIDPILTAAGYQSSGLLSGIDSDTIVGQVQPKVKDPGQRKYSITPQQDRDYLDAVNRGDMETAQRMVDFMADITGFTVDGYHGTDAQFNEFKIGDIGYHIGTKQQAEDRNRQAGLRSTQSNRQHRVMHLYAKISNPLYVAFDFGDWHGQNVAGMLLETEQWEEGYDDNAAEINRRLNEIARMHNNSYTDRVLREFLQELGYDGIVYENRFEGWDDETGSGDESYIVFESSQLKLADPVTYDDSGNIIPLSKRFDKSNDDIRYSITPEFEKWYKEEFGADVTDAQLKRRLQTQERRAKQAEESAKAAEFKRVMDTENQLTAWMIHHTKTLRAQKRDADAKFAAAKKERAEAIREAVALTKDVERAKADLQHEGDMIAMKRQAAQRLRTKETAYKQKVTELKENLKLKRNAAKATLRNAKLAEKKRAAIETEQGPVNTIRMSPKERKALENRQTAAQALRTLGRTAYRNFWNQAEAIDRFAKRQISDLRAGTLVTVLGGAASTVESIYKTGLVNRAGDRIAGSMKEVFLCWDDAMKNVDEAKQALLQDFMLHLHNIDRMSIESRAASALETFENQNPWLRDMDPKELARLVAMTDKEVEKLGKQKAQQAAFKYLQMLHHFNTSRNKPIFADENGNPVTAETSQQLVKKYLDENPWLLEKANGIYEWWDLFMREWAVGDTISETEYAIMHEMYPHYAPTYRIDKVGVGGANFVGMGGASVSKAVKRARGGLSEVMNIEDSFSNIVSKIVRLQRVNALYMNIVDTAMLDDDGTFADMAAFDWESSWQTGAYAEALTGDLEDNVDDAEKAGLEKVGQDYKLTGWMGGRKYTAFISEDLYKSIGNVTGHLANDLEKGLLKIGNTLTGPMKTAITGINPNFALRNLSRDLPTAIVNSISGMAFPKYWAQAAKEMMQNSENWQRFQALGGTHATYYNDNKGFADAMAQGKNVVAKAIDKMGAFNEATEAQTRFAEYLATIDRFGDTYESRLQGIKNAAEVTVDFSRKGRYGKVINAFVPYWNPAMQGIDKVVRSVIDSPDGSAVWKQASKTLGRAAMTTVLFEAICFGVLKALDRDDEWEELSDRTKDTYYCIPLKDSHTFLKIPKSREWGAILGTPFMRLLEYANGRENPFENYIETAIEPNFLPPAILRPDAGGGFTSDIIGVSQALDLAKNEDFAGRTIVPYAYEQGSLNQQYDNETSWFAKQLGALLNLSPMQIDYVIEDYFGDFGELFTQAASAATWSSDSTAVDFAKSALDLVTSPWTADNRYSNYSVNKYYELMDELSRVVQDKKNQLGSAAYKETVEYQAKEALNTLYGKQISDLNTRVRELPDGPEKDAAKEQIARLAGDAVRYYKDIMSGVIKDPILDAEYADLSSVVSNELIRMDSYSGEYKFKPTGTASARYTDPADKTREYVLTSEQKDKFAALYREEYDRTYAALIQSSKYRSAKETAKAALLEDARDDVLKATKEEFFAWLKRTGARSTPKK